MAEEKKIIIDEDWKNQAKKEKETLAEETKEESQAQQQQLPKGDMGALISILATQSLYAMGFIATEENKTPDKNLPLAKMNIDLLETLEEKTKGNLTDDEKKALTDTLSQLRMAFVSASK